LRQQGVRTSKDRVRQLLREHGLLSASRQPEPVRRHPHEMTSLTEAPNQIWGTDATAAFTQADGAVTISATDHYTAECVGIHAVKKATRFEALEPVRQGVHEYFGGFAAGQATGLRLRHDHGSVYMSEDFQSEIQFLGIEPSRAFVRQPEGNGCIERFFRTLKEQLLWIRCFPDWPNCALLCMSSATATTTTGFSNVWTIEHPFRQDATTSLKYTLQRDSMDTTYSHCSVHPVPCGTVVAPERVPSVPCELPQNQLLTAYQEVIRSPSPPAFRT
jgi:transposase InsO family protein